jgi:probable rRNA maturation factor
VDPDSKRLRVSVTDGRGRPVRDGGLARWLESVAPARARGDVAIALAGDAQVRALNRRYRRKDAATDVLSFPADTVDQTSRKSNRTTDHGPGTTIRDPRPAARDLWTVDRGPRTAVLGDIVIATGVARRQASNAGHSAQTELRVLALHGLLHLLGYDHHDPRASGRMAGIERRLRRKGGLPAGLIERASAHGTRS